MKAQEKKTQQGHQDGGSPELNESWFERPRPTTRPPPPRRPSEYPLGDPLADDWFR